MSRPSQVDRTRTAYDRAAAGYAEVVVPLFATLTDDLDHLRAFADDVLAGGGGPVHEVGCGPGHVTAYLAGAGLDASGSDLSPGMVAEARRRYPALTFEVASMLSMPWPPRSFAGVVSWYSLIHVEPERRAEVLAGMRRVLRSGGHLLLGFQAAAGAGDEERRVDRGYGHEDLDLVAWRLDVDVLCDALGDNGFRVERRDVREPGESEGSRQGFVRALAV